MVKKANNVVNQNEKSLFDLVIDTLAIVAMWIQIVTLFLDSEYFFGLLSLSVSIFTFVMIKNRAKGRITILYSISGIILFLFKFVLMGASIASVLRGGF